MKLAKFIEELENAPHAGAVSDIECGTSRKGNRKLEIQQFSYWPDNFGSNDEHESWFYLVVDADDNILFWTQTV